MPCGLPKHGNMFRIFKKDDKKKAGVSSSSTQDAPVPPTGAEEYIQDRYPQAWQTYRKDINGPMVQDPRHLKYNPASGTTAYTGMFGGDAEELNDVCAYVEIDDIQEHSYNNLKSDKQFKPKRVLKTFDQFESWDAWAPTLDELIAKTSPQVDEWKPSTKPAGDRWLAADIDPASPTKPHEHDDPLGRWPTRLLHVPTMTSYPRAPNGSYGGKKNPQYNAISYTWGRFMIRDQAKKHVPQASTTESPTDTGILGLKGISLKSSKSKSDPVSSNEHHAKHLAIDVKIELSQGRKPWPIPHIRKQHFSVSEFMHVIQQCSVNSGVEFLWLDVACIDQNRDSPDKELEIGRQAKIFGGANNVFVWNTAYQSDYLQQLLGTVIAAGEVARVYNRDGRLVQRDEPWAKAATRALQAIMVDPWWSSLWTLQEAYLCPNALFVDRQGKNSILNGSPVPKKLRGQSASLAHLAEACSHISQTHQRSRGHYLAMLENVSQLPEFHAFIQQLRGALNQIPTRNRPQMTDAQLDLESDQYGIEAPAAVREARRPAPLIHFATVSSTQGLSALRASNPLALYSAARARTATRDFDCIYGIQQVFGLALGTSRPGAPKPKTARTLRDLEYELGWELLARSPLCSQMHRFTTPADFSSAWRVNADSRIPDLFVGPALWNLPTSCAAELTPMPPQPARSNYAPRSRDEHLYDERIAWSQLRGRAAPLPALRAAWAAADARAAPLHPGHRNLSTAKIELDGAKGEISATLAAWNAAQGGIATDLAAWTAAYADFVSGVDGMQPASGGPGVQDGAAAALERAFAGRTLRVLLLGGFEASRDELLVPDGAFGARGRRRRETFKVGVLVVRHAHRGFEYWHRLGLVAWQTSHVADLKVAAGVGEVLRGEGSTWEVIEGLYG